MKIDTPVYEDLFIKYFPEGIGLIGETSRHRDKPKEYITSLKYVKFPMRNVAQTREERAIMKYHIAMFLLGVSTAALAVVSYLYFLG